VTDLAAVRSIPLFDGLDDAQLATVAAVLRRRVVATGKVIFAEGEHSSSVYILVRGSVGTSKRLGLAVRAPEDNQKQKVLVHLAAPQFFGEMGIISDLERSATITTDGECELLELSRADFDRIAGQDPALAYRLIRNIAAVLAERLRRTDLDLLKLTTALSLALGNR